MSLDSGGLIGGANIIVFSGDDWSSGLKTTKYHVARQLARHNNVLFVNSVGLRRPTASGRHLKRAVGKLLTFFKGPVSVPEGLHVYTPIIFPFARDNRLVKFFNSLLLRLCMRRLKSRLGLDDPIVIAFTVSFNGVIDSLDARAVVYYCIDDLSSFPGIDREWFEREEEWLLSRADCTIACSEELHAALHRKGHQTHYVPHGVDWQLFRRAVTEQYPLPEDMRDIPEPRLGFYGFLTAEWIDFPLLKRMAAEHPDWHIVLIGKPDVKLDIPAIIPEPNIHYLGLKPFEELPAYTRHFSVGLIPFIINPITYHCSPLKLLEYLSGGLPVVSSDIPEVRKYGTDAHVARSPDEFIAMCETALREGDPQSRDRRSRAAEVHSWEKRMEQISRIILAEVTPSAAQGRG